MEATGDTASLATASSRNAEVTTGTKIFTDFHWSVTAPLTNTGLLPEQTTQVTTDATITEVPVDTITVEAVVNNISHVITSPAKFEKPAGMALMLKFYLLVQLKYYLIDRKRS